MIYNIYNMYYIIPQTKEARLRWGSYLPSIVITPAFQKAFVSKLQEILYSVCWGSRKKTFVYLQSKSSPNKGGTTEVGFLLTFYSNYP